MVRRALFALLAGGFILLFLNLAYWQYQRAEEKQQLFDRFNQGTETPLSPAQLNTDTPIYSHIHIDQPNYLDARYYWDNRHQQQKGQVGYEQIALIDLPSGELLMVNLGWQAAPATRDKLPELMPLPNRLEGRMRPMTAPLQLSDAQDPVFPQRLQFPDAHLISSKQNKPVLPWMLELNQDWQPSTMTPTKHRGYMWQWLALALACSLLTLYWLYTELKSPRSREHARRHIHDPQH